MDAQQADQILDQRHDERHDEEHHEIIADAAGKAAENGVFDQRHTEQDDGADAVQRHAWPEQKAGVEPLMLRVGAGKELAEQQLQHPSGAGTEEKQEYDIQKDLIFRHKLPSCAQFTMTAGTLQGRTEELSSRRESSETPGGGCFLSGFLYNKEYQNIHRRLS